MELVRFELRTSSVRSITPEAFRGTPVPAVAFEHECSHFAATRSRSLTKHKEKALLPGLFVMGGTGLEPVTPSLSSWCSPN